VAGRRPEEREVPAEVDPDDRVPVFGREVGRVAVPEEAREVRHAVEPAVGRDGRLDQRRRVVEVADVPEVGGGVAARLPDLPGDGLGRRRALALAVDRGPEVVDQHRRASAGERVGGDRADTVATAGHDTDAAVEVGRGGAVLRAGTHAVRLAWRST
jgi:hypothetical protein